MRQKTSQFDRYIVTPKVSKFRFFVFVPQAVLPSNLVIVIGRDDDATFGVLSSRFHETWSLAQGQWIGVGNDPTYTPSTTFETFPFPEGLTPNIPATDYAADLRAQKIAAAAARLNELRENWLNPADLVVRVPEVVPGYPDRILPKDAAAEVILKKRTLTNRKRRLRLIDFASVRSLTWLRERFLQQTEGWHGEWCRRICPSA